MLAQGKCFQVLYFDQFLLNERYEDSHTKKILDLMSK